MKSDKLIPVCAPVGMNDLSGTSHVWLRCRTSLSARADHEATERIRLIAHNFMVFLANSNAKPEQEIRGVRCFRARRVDGVLVMASRVGAMYLPRLRERNVPIVPIDDREGARLAVRHLLERGRRRIAYIPDRYGLQRIDLPGTG